MAPNTTSVITSKSISRGGGRASYRGLLRVNPGAKGAKSKAPKKSKKAKAATAKDGLSAKRQAPIRQSQRLTASRYDTDAPCGRGGGDCASAPQYRPELGTGCCARAARPWSAPLVLGAGAGHKIAYPDSDAVTIARDAVTRPRAVCYAGVAIRGARGTMWDVQA